MGLGIRRWNIGPKFLCASRGHCQRGVIVNMVYNASVRIGPRGEEQGYTLRLSSAGGPIQRGPPALATSVHLCGNRGARGLEQDQGKNQNII